MTAQFPEPEMPDVTAAITMVVPTRNRGHTLSLVGSSYCDQQGVDEIIFVNDHGDDDTPAVIAKLAAEYPSVTLTLLRNEKRSGAAASRNKGAAAARNPFILFCDDDEYLQEGYAAACREKLVRLNAGAISGRRVYMREGETKSAALRRFGDGFRKRSCYDRLLCELVPAAHFTGEADVPFANAIVLTRKSLILQYRFDERYVRGNGYREESDYQMNLFVNGYRNFITNDVHSIHLPFNQVRKGGSQTAKLSDLYWSVYYTNYFYRKYWDRYQRRLGLRLPRVPAVILFSVFKFYGLFFRSYLVRLGYAGIGLVKTGRAGLRRVRMTDGG